MSILKATALSVVFFSSVGTITACASEQQEMVDPPTLDYPNTPDFPAAKLEDISGGNCASGVAFQVYAAHDTSKSREFGNGREGNWIPFPLIGASFGVKKENWNHQEIHGEDRFSRFTVECEGLYELKAKALVNPSSGTFNADIRMALEVFPTEGGPIPFRVLSADVETKLGGTWHEKTVSGLTWLEAGDEVRVNMRTYNEQNKLRLRWASLTVKSDPTFRPEPSQFITQEGSE